MRWEYKVMDLTYEHLEDNDSSSKSVEAALNELGGMQWEVVALLPSQSRTGNLTAILKRPRDDSRW